MLLARCSVGRGAVSLTMLIGKVTCFLLHDVDDLSCHFMKLRSFFSLKPDAATIKMQVAKAGRAYPSRSLSVLSF